MKLWLSIFLLLGGVILPAGAQEITQDATESTEAVSAENVEGDETAVSGEQIPVPEVEPEPEIIYVEEQVFSPKFMKSLITCKPDSETQDERVVEIVGPKEDYCLLKYSDFDLNVPRTLLGNIHGFDDVELLLKNKDISHYNRNTEYIYDGLMYALNACFHKKDYDGKQEEQEDGYVLIERGLYSEFFNDICAIHLKNIQNIDGAITDYSVICSLPYKAVQELEPKFRDLVEEYGEKRGFGANGRVTVKREQENKQTHEADIALMYILQQNGYCKKNIE